jgi:hypothetical protein
MNPKLTPEHLRRGAIVYVRQSTLGQVVEHTESKRRQYALADSAREIGFVSVSVSDDDLGRSGSGLVERPGFQSLFGNAESRLSGQAAEHEGDRSNLNHRLTMVGAAFIVAGQAAMAHEPAESTCHNPALGQQAKAFGLRRAGDDLQPQLAPRPQALDPRHQRPGITPIGPDELQAPQQEYGAGQEAASAVAILHVGPGDVDGQKQPQGVHQDMAFVHILLSVLSTPCVGKGVQLLKGNSSKWIHDTFKGHWDFEWQEGYGAFSIGISGVEDTMKYIQGQEEHHRQTTFKEELEVFLKKHGMEFAEQDLE